MLDIKKEDLEIINRILDKYFADFEVWAFGSRVKGTAKITSDIDLVVVSKEKLEFGKIDIVKEEFMESNISIRVDLLDWNLLDENFKKIIKNNYFVIKKI
jgi:uncharacterized protein